MESKMRYDFKRIFALLTCKSFSEDEQTENTHRNMHFEEKCAIAWLYTEVLLKNFFHIPHKKNAVPGTKSLLYSITFSVLDMASKKWIMVIP